MPSPIHRRTNSALDIATRIEESVRVHDKVPINRGLGKRVDLLAVEKPWVNQRWIWISGFLAVWALIGAVYSAVARNWTVAAIFAGTVVVEVAMWWLSVRAKRRAPETKRWLDALSR
jgi:hypothetical protein